MFVVKGLAPLETTLVATIEVTPVALLVIVKVLLVLTPRVLAPPERPPDVLPSMIVYPMLLPAPTGLIVMLLTTIGPAVSRVMIGGLSVVKTLPAPMTASAPLTQAVSDDVPLLYQLAALKSQRPEPSEPLGPLANGSQV